MGELETLLEQVLGEDWSTKVEQVTVFFVPAVVIKTYFRNRSERGDFGWKGRFYAKYGRGLASGNKVFVTQETFDLSLLAHELGHTPVCGGKKHTPFFWFGVMHPCGLFRWFSNPFVSVWKFFKHGRI